MTVPEPTPLPTRDPRTLGLLVAEVERLREAALRAAGPALPSRPPRELPLNLTDDEQRVVELLLRLRQTVLSQPAAGHALTSFLIGEGQRFAATQQGRRWHEMLRDAPEVERLRQIWEATTLNIFDDDGDVGVVPEAWVDLIADLASIGRVDWLVSALLPEGLA